MSHGSTSDDDEEGIEIHLKELVKKAKKERATQDIDKIIRLQSITTTFRLRKIEEFPSAPVHNEQLKSTPFSCENVQNIKVLKYSYLKNFYSLECSENG